MFRQPDGTTTESAELRLSLKDFFREDVLDSVEGFSDMELAIPSEELCKYYDLALKDHHDSVEMKGALAAAAQQSATSARTGGQLGSIRRLIQGFNLRRSARVARMSRD